MAELGALDPGGAERYLPLANRTVGSCHAIALPSLLMLIGQVIRYGLVGGAVTVLQGAVYWLLSSQAGWDPQLSNFAGYLAAVTTGFLAHGSFTFRGHEAQSAAPVRLARFVGVSLISLGLNAFWVWLMVTALGAPLWAPLPFMAVVTPGVVFVLNRQWVFR